MFVFHSPRFYIRSIRLISVCPLERLHHSLVPLTSNILTIYIFYQDARNPSKSTKSSSPEHPEPEVNVSYIGVTIIYPFSYLD